MLSTSASQGGASWKGSCLGCDESSQTEEAGASLGVEPLVVPGSACLQTRNIEVMKKQAFLLKGTLPWLVELKGPSASGNREAVPGTAWQPWLPT